jgi:N-acetylmuramoyl-L-alanine amidase
LAGAFAAGAVVVWLASYAWTSPDGAAALETAPPPDPRSARPGAYDWSAQPEPSFPIPPYARFLKNVEIVVDPGHIGQRDRPNWKRGPTGLREAAVNLRVAQYLREFLAAAGATVILTRDEDRSLDLDDQADLNERAAIANDARADLFLSIHHNGVNNPSANYTSVFYHKSPDHSPASLCAARFVLQGVNDALRLESHLACALLSDHLVAKKNGFRVLRLARVPAVLC